MLNQNNIPINIILTSTRKTFTFLQGIKLVFNIFASQMKSKGYIIVTVLNFVWTFLSILFQIQSFYPYCQYCHINYGQACCKRASQVAEMVKNPACNVGDLGSIPELGRSLKKGMATHSNILAWRILWTDEPGGATIHGVAN